uniref:Nucleotidyltransferase family protein n=1 Tax=Acidobacterium capsulatum TaxID=33075 RepID=A0A7V5CSV8_9BACT
MPSSTPGAAILLAAGSSSRLGQPKQLVRHQGQSLLRRTASLALASGASPVIVVLGNSAPQLRPELEGLSVSVVENPDWATGMASSLRCGLAQLLRQAPAAPAALLLVCDQPHLQAVHLRQLWQQYQASNQVVAAQQADGHPGVPAIFPACCFPQLAALQGDQGARALLRQLPPSELQTISMPEALADLDTPADLARLRAQNDKGPE